MITLSNNTKCLALLHQVEEIYVYTSDSLLETVVVALMQGTISTTGYMHC